MNRSSEELNKITEKIIGCAYKVSNTLGIGFLEKVYENALGIEMTKEGLKVIQQHPVQVKYDGFVVGEYVVDMLIEGCVLIELKTVKQLDENHMAQCMNYLKATGFNICLLLNFGNNRLQIKRIVHHLNEVNVKDKS